MPPPGATWGKEECTGGGRGWNEGPHCFVPLKSPVPAASPCKGLTVRTLNDVDASPAVNVKWGVLDP